MRVALVGAELEENLALRSIHAAVADAGHEASEPRPDAGSPSEDPG